MVSGFVMNVPFRLHLGENAVASLSFVVLAQSLSPGNRQGTLFGHGQCGVAKERDFPFSAG